MKIINSKMVQFYLIKSTITLSISGLNISNKKIEIFG